MLKFIWIFFCFPALCSIGQQWQALPDFPGLARDDGSAFVIGNKAYCGTGVTSTMGPQIDFYAFDMPSASWSQVASLPEWAARQYCTAFTDGTNGFLFGGYGWDDYYGDLWKYQVGSDTWMQAAPMPDEARSGATSFTLGNDTYIIGGKNATSDALSDVWVYHMDTDSWTQKSDLPSGGRWRASGFSHEGFGYVVFGRDESGDYRGEVFKYNPDTDTWTEAGYFPGNGRNYVSVQKIGDEAMFFGGLDVDNTLYKDLWSLDVETMDWTEFEPLPAAGRRGGMSFTDGSSLYYTSGYIQGGTRTLETWKATDFYPVPEVPEVIYIAIYPNPTSGFVNLGFENNEHRLFEGVRVFDRLGREYFQHPIEEARTMLDVSTLAPGVYVFYFYGSRGVARLPFVKI
jgi:N-acetylneuraminic acid mutarotase